MHPLVPVLLALISGAVLSGRFVISASWAVALFALSLAPSLICLAKRRPFSPLFMVPPFFFIGVLSVIPFLRPEFPPAHIVNFARAVEAAKDYSPRASLQSVEGAVVDLPEFAEGRTRVLVEAKRVLKDDAWRNTSGLLYLTVNGRADLDPGDYIRFQARLREPYNYGNPGEFDYRSYLNLKSIFVTGFVKDSSRITRIFKGAQGLFGGERKSIREFIDSSGAGNKAFLKALIIGEQAGIGTADREAFSRTGTAHILSVSGLHVGIIAVFSYTVILFLLKRSERLMLAVNVRKAALAASLIPVYFYGMVADFPVATLRSVIMVAAFVLAFLINRGKDLLNTLALAALIILLFMPYSIWDVSFQLSFAAVFSIIYLAPRLEALLSGEKKESKTDDEKGFRARLRLIWSRKIRPAIFVTLAAGAGTSPILAYHFHRVTLTGVAANLVAVPVTALVVPVLFVSYPAYGISAGLGYFLVRLSDLVSGALLLAIKWFSSLPYSSVWVAAPTAHEIVLYCLLLFLAVNLRKGRRFVYAAAVVTALIAADQAYYYGWNRGGKDLRVTFISIGQGESELVEMPEGSTMLIDGGGVWGGFDVGEKVLAPFLWSKKITSIDYLVLSHAQRDHMAGLKFIAENFSVGEFWWNGRGDLGELGEILKSRGIPMRTVDGSTPSHTIGKASVEALHPSGPLEFDENDMCLVLRVGYGNTRFLFTGDIAGDAEEELSKKDIRADVLKAPHHGSRYSSSEEFLRAVGPSVVVVSAGRYNVFHFPHRETLERYSALGLKVFRTDIDGAVKITSDGKNLSEEAYLTEAPRWSILNNTVQAPGGGRDTLQRPDGIKDARLP